MQTDQNEDLIRRWIAFANSGFAGPFDHFIAAEYVGHLGEVHMGLMELEQAERAFASAFPNTQHSIDDLVACNDRVVLRVTSRGTHRGEFQGIAATGRRIEFTGIVITEYSIKRS
jgi:predicted ester cyclase